MRRLSLVVVFALGVLALTSAKQPLPDPTEWSAFDGGGTYATVDQFGNYTFAADVYGKGFKDAVYETRVEFVDISNGKAYPFAYGANTMYPWPNPYDGKIMVTGPAWSYKAGAGSAVAKLVAKGEGKITAVAYLTRVDWEEGWGWVRTTVHVAGREFIPVAIEN